MKKLFSLNYKKLEVYIYALLIFLLIPPYFTWNGSLTYFFIFALSLLSIKNIIIENESKIMVFLLLVAFYLFLVVKNNLNFNALLLLICISIMTLTSEKFLKSVFEKFILIYAIALVPSILSYLIVNLFGVNLPHQLIPSLNSFKSYNYVQYFFHVQEDTFMEMLLPRFSSYFDEPGVVGTISGIIMLCTGFDLRKKINIPIFISGILSFSFAFYIIMLVYGVVFLKFKNKITFIVVMIVVAGLLSTNEVFDSYILSRFEINNNKIVGDNRIADSDFDSFYKNFKTSDDFFFGLGFEKSTKLNFGGSSYKDFIVGLGIIPFIVFCLIFILNAYFKIRDRYKYLLYIFIFIAIIYQRPFITNFFYIFLIFVPIIYLSNNATIKNAS